MIVTAYLVIKEFVFHVDGMEQTVKGRISRNTEPTAERPYMWEISHHYAPREGAGTYYPSVVATDQLETTESLLMAYANGFTPIAVEANTSY